MLGIGTAEINNIFYSDIDQRALSGDGGCMCPPGLQSLMYDIQCTVTLKTVLLHGASAFNGENISIEGIWLMIPFLEST